MENKILIFIKDIINDIFASDPNEDNDKEIEIKKHKKYISRDNAIALADKENNFRKYMYKEAKNNGYKYGLIEIKEYSAVLVKYKKMYAWYIKVIEGKYIRKDENKYYKGYYDKYSNISAIVLAESEEFIYLGKDYDTRNIRMVTDDEFLEYIHNVRH